MPITEPALTKAEVTMGRKVKFGALIPLGCVGELGFSLSLAKQ